MMYKQKQASFLPEITDEFARNLVQAIAAWCVTLGIAFAVELILRGSASLVSVLDTGVLIGFILVFNPPVRAAMGIGVIQRRKDIAPDYAKAATIERMQQVFVSLFLRGTLLFGILSLLNVLKHRPEMGNETLSVAAFSFLAALVTYAFGKRRVA